MRRAIDFDPALGDKVEQAAADLGYGTMRLRSRAGHDAIRMAAFCRSQMIFVPCEDGISHSERENMTEGDAAAGAAVLLRVLCQLAGCAARRPARTCVQPNSHVIARERPDAGRSGTYGRASSAKRLA